jgi:hypothetical protein
MRSVEKAAIIPFAHVYQQILESDGAWGIQSQRLPNVIYTMKFPFTEIFVAHVNGHYEGTCVNTKLWSFSHA